MHVADTIVERRIQQAREEGLFDNLPGRGKPIADLGRQRPPGWWALRQAEVERAKLAADELHQELRKARAALWRAETESALRAEVTALNKRIAEHNRRHPRGPATPLVMEQTVATWYRLRRSR
ncbi:MAG: DnaJ family domain-containing protein [Actinomycetota bacterium]